MQSFVTEEKASTSSLSHSSYLTQSASGHSVWSCQSAVKAQIVSQTWVPAPLSCCEELCIQLPKKTTHPVLTEVILDTASTSYLEVDGNVFACSATHKMTFFFKADMVRIQTTDGLHVYLDAPPGSSTAGICSVSSNAKVPKCQEWSCPCCSKKS